MEDKGDGGIFKQLKDVSEGQLKAEQEQKKKGKFWPFGKGAGEFSKAKQEKQRKYNLAHGVCDPLYKRLLQDIIEEHKKATEQLKAKGGSENNML